MQVVFQNFGNVHPKHEANALIVEVIKNRVQPIEINTYKANYKRLIPTDDDIGVWKLKSLKN